ncbi:MAG: phosphoadenosine phosphosulfate reductase family protein [Ignavibacteriae bacterium]|nr:phosphoadenosine phosphosulfate reductase family protein [Ignavibacteriota bacterium]MBX3045187.1 phosphoadenosine phosphosulfate reductase family protein [Ignavibacteriota bacterium]
MFDNRIKQIFDTINKSFETINKPYLSISWGKDSILLLYFVRQVNPKVKCVYLNSGYALPDTYEVRDRLLQEWDMNYSEIKSDYFAIKDFKPPDQRTKQEQKKYVDILKKIPFDKFAKENGYDGNFWGIRACESIGRKHLIKTNGLLFKSSNGLYRSSPIGWVTNEELWYFYDKFNIPMNLIYTKTKFINKDQIRNTGWLSTDGEDRGRIIWLRHYYPQQYKKLITMYPYLRGIT